MYNGAGVRFVNFILFFLIHVSLENEIIWSH